MMYGPPPPEYPRATSSPPIIVLVAGLAALLGFLLGIFVGFGASSTSADEPAPRVTVTVEDSPPADPEATTPTEPSPSQTGQPVPGQTQPGQTQPGQTQPGQTQPGQTQPGQTQPGQTQPGQTQPGQTQPGQTQPGQTQPGQTQPPGQARPGQTGVPDAGTSSGPAINPASMRTLVVGTDIQPGTYRTTGPVAGSGMCYWARLRGATDIVATGMPKGPASVTIEPADKAFVTGGCAEWTKA
ncbi:hypothetical protein [Nonomuraea sp. B19D2]|uniref:hypothetical protein n=1 Tax=Nonomuraea sp. B19D2 TaxID=3159561 RepID=UPI0032DA161F